MAEHDFGLPSGRCIVTISLGVAQYHDLETEAAFFARADVALYGAKNGGRNHTNASHLPIPAPQLF